MNRRPLAVLIIAMLLAPALALILTSQSGVIEASPDSWWNESWPYRVPLTLDVSGGAPPENYQYRIVLDNADNLGGHVAFENFQDLRFWENEDSGELEFWFENYVSGDNVVAWVRREDNSLADNMIYVYYGNASAGVAENVLAVFEVPADVGFDASTGWTTGGTAAPTIDTADSRVEYSLNNESGWAYADRGTGIDNFVVDFTINADSVNAGAGSGVGLSDEAGDFGSGWTNGVFAVFYTAGGSVQRIYIITRISSVQHNVNSNFTYANITWYGTLEGHNDNFELWLWDNPDRSGTENLYLTIVESGMPSLRYGYGMVSYNDATYQTGWIDTMLFRKYASPEPTASAGAEEIPEVVYPTQPTLYLPADGSTIYDDTPRFEWTKGENADNHRLLVDNDPDFSSPDENRILVADNYYTIADENALSRDNYSWKVISVNDNGENESPVWTFLNYLTPRVIWSYHDPSGYAVGVGMATDASSMAGGTELTDKLYFWGIDNDNVPEWTYTNTWETDVRLVEMSDDGRYIAVTFIGGIRLFENSDNTPIWSYYTGLGTTPYVDISASGTRIVGSESGNVWLWDNADNTPIWSYKQGTYSNGAHVSADGNYVIAVFENYIIKFTDSDNTPVWTYNTDFGVHAANTTISDNGDYCAVAAGSGFQDIPEGINWGYLYLFGGDNSPVWIYNLELPPNLPYGLDITSTGHRIVAGDRNTNYVRVFTNQDNVEIFSWSIGTSVWSAEIHDSGEYLAVGSGTFSPSEIGHFWFFGVVENKLYNKYDLESLGWDLKLSDNATRSFASSDHTRKFFYFETDFSAPSQPTPVSPENDTQIFDNTPNFEWTKGTGATSHRLLIDNDSDFESTNENRTFVVDNTYTIPSENSLPSDNYFWKVIAVNALGENESIVFEFELISRAWELIETWTGTLQVPAAWELIETWSGTVEAYASWNLIETWTGTVEAYAAWELIETWSGTVEAFAQWELIETWTGTVQTPSAWGLIEQWTGTVEAFAEWTLIETWTGTIEAFAEWDLIETWTGAIEAPAAWQSIESWTGDVEAPVAWLLVETWTGSVEAPVVWQLVETWTGSVEAFSGWDLIESWTGEVDALTIWNLIETWSGSIQAYAEWSEVESWTGTVYAFGWDLIETWMGAVRSPAWQLIENWAGTIRTPAVFAVSISITPSENSGTLGDTLTYAIMVINIGGATDNYDLASSDPQGWATYLDNDNFLNVPSGENRETTLNVGLSTMGTHEVIVTATGTGVSDSDNCTAISRSKYVPPPGGTIGGEFVGLGVAVIAIGLAVGLAFLFAQRRRDEE